MRKLLLAAALTAVPTVASAQVGYIEGVIGLSLISDLETKDFSVGVLGYGQFDGHGEFDVGSEFSAGVEAGFARDRLRFGISWDYATADLETVRLVGLLDGAPYSEEVPGSILEAAAGVTFDESVHIVAGNAYYNFGDPAATWRPYVGLGAGAALFETVDAKPALHATAGVRFAIGANAYAGGRYRFTWIEGPEAGGGISYQDITLHTFSVVLGFYFVGP